MEEDDEWESDQAFLEWLESPEYVNGRKMDRDGWFRAETTAAYFNRKRGKLNMNDRLGKLLSLDHATVFDASPAAQLTMKLIADTQGDIYADCVRLVINDSYTINDVVDRIKSVLDDARAAMPFGENGSVLVQGQYKHAPMLIWVNKAILRRNRRVVKALAGVTDLSIELIGNPIAIKAVAEHIKSGFAEEKFAEVKWWTTSQHGEVTREIYLPKNEQRVLPEYYPDLADPAKYISDYLAADESVLLMAGPPGTGKTTLLRHMITEHKLTAHVVYDEKLMQSDNVFSSFLFDEDGDIMIIEDADTILGAREAEGNKLMSRFLNVSDGLIKLPNKKLVFTTNLTDFSKVDQALLRPGRCYGVLHTRPLNLAEAQAAAKVANLPIPMEKREYTIAELFNQGKTAPVRSVGFGVRH